MKYNRSILPYLTRVGIGMFEVILKNNFIFKKVGMTLLYQNTYKTITA